MSQAFSSFSFLLLLLLLLLIIIIIPDVEHTEYEVLTRDLECCIREFYNDCIKPGTVYKARNSV